ncbi:MAG: acetolactate synthase large subunit, partial [bacterium]|nr:acetolactate synthase large subunit [bacterium]
ARVPIVNIVGDQATYHRPLDPLLAADTEGWADGVSAWTRVTERAEDVGADAAAAIRVANTAPGQIATLILPSDASWDAGGVVGAPLPVPVPEVVDEAAISESVRILRSGEPTLLLLAGATLPSSALADAHRIADETGAQLSADTFITRIERGRGRHAVGRVPYPIDEAAAAISRFRHVILVNGVEPVSFFAYPGKSGRLVAGEGSLKILARPDQDGPDALSRLADALGCSPAVAPPAKPSPAPAVGAVTSEALAATLSALLPEESIIVDESVTFGIGLYPATGSAAPHDWLQVTGGAIGDGPPLATGAAIGAPGRRVVNLEADGSALYTVQALWTQARENLDVTTIIFSNRRYAILIDELANVGAESGPVSDELFSLRNPDMDWVQIAGGLGVEGARAETMDQFAGIFTQANGQKGPFLITYSGVQYSNSERSLDARCMTRGDIVKDKHARVHPSSVVHNCRLVTRIARSRCSARLGRPARRPGSSASRLQYSRSCRARSACWAYFDDGGARRS